MRYILDIEVVLVVLVEAEEKKDEEEGDDTFVVVVEVEEGDATMSAHPTGSLSPFPWKSGGGDRGNTGDVDNNTEYDGRIRCNNDVTKVGRREVPRKEIMVLLLRLQLHRSSSPWPSPPLLEVVVLQ